MTEASTWGMKRCQTGQRVVQCTALVVRTLSSLVKNAIKSAHSWMLSNVARHLSTCCVYFLNFGSPFRALDALTTIRRIRTRYSAAGLCPSQVESNTPRSKTLVATLENSVVRDDASAIQRSRQESYLFRDQLWTMMGRNRVAPLILC